jgi:diaminopimelate epimerase
VTDGLYKFEGAGNDFLLGCGVWARRLAAEPAVVRRLCDRHRGLGADGTVALEMTSADRVSMTYRNSDGGIATFCANATRCVARAAVEFLSAPTRLKVITGWAEIPAAVEDGRVTLELPAPTGPSSRPEISRAWARSPITRLEVGVPHLLVEVDDVGSLELPALAPDLRRHREAGREGANVNFFAIDGDIVHVRSWERGVEGETLCCGSGLVAVALEVMAERGPRTVELEPASGDRLTVEALGDPPQCATRFTGPARFIARLEPSPELLRP